MMKNRLIAIFLCLLMLAALLPAAVADEQTEAPADTPDEPVVIIEPEAEEPEAGPELAVDAPEEEPDAVLTDPEEDIDAASIILINEENFPDENFRKWIVANVPGVTVDANGVCSMLSTDAKKVTVIDVTGQKISSLSGIRRFPNLQTLICPDNKISYLNVSKQNELVYLNCANNKMTKLVLGSTKKLVSLYCQSNAITELKTTYNPALEILWCQNNALKTLEVKASTKLRELNCAHNSVAKLDVTKNVLLEKLDLESNKVTALDVTKCTNLEELNANYNEIKKIDVTKCPKLSFLAVRACGLSALDITKNTELTYLECAVNTIGTLDVSGCTKLNQLDCATNELKSVDVTKATGLAYLHIDGNMIGSIDISKNTALVEFTAFENNLKTLDVSKNTQLRRLSCGGNALTAISLVNNAALEELDVSFNKIEALNLTANTKLKELWCQGNCLKMLDLTMLAELDKLECSDQEVMAPTGIVYSGGDYKFDMNTMFSSFEKVQLAVYPLNTITGYVTLPGYIDSFEYLYDTGHGQMNVKLYLPYSGPATVEFSKPTVDFRGTTPFVVYDGKAKTPTVTVKDADGKVIASNRYTVAYTNNTDPGTATVTVSFINTMNTATGWFKIYLPGPTQTTVENVKDGIKVKWNKVDKAIGYVIYRRAWNASSSDWTVFQRWNNTTATEWIDKTVYAGTRYQYGIKAYFTNAFDTNNLGEVGPLKTTVRMTTRVLTELKPYTGKLVAKWEGSKYCTGYEVQYARDAAFTSSVKTATVNKPTTYTRTISNLKSSTTYYVRVRSYTVMGDMTYYGEWSNVLSAKTK